MKLGADPRKWARLVFCVAFHVILLGLAGEVLAEAFGADRPGRALFLPGILAAGLIGWFYTSDRTGNRIAEAGHLAGALTAVHLWADFSYALPASGLSAWEFFGAWHAWGSYLGNALAVLAAGVWNERRR